MWRTVRLGDTFKTLAKKHGTTPQALAALNQMRVTDSLRVGGKIRIS